LENTSASYAEGEQSMTTLGVTVVLCGSYVEFVSWCLENDVSPGQACRQGHIVYVSDMSGVERLMGCLVKEIIRYGTWETVPQSVVAMVEARHRRWKMKHTL
jgi:hypothetical protein